MKRLGRRLFNFAAGLSLVLCVAAVAWRVFRPYYFYDGVQFYPGNHVLLVGASEGALTVEWADAIAGDFAPQDPTTRPWFYIPSIWYRWEEGTAETRPLPPRHKFLGFGYGLSNSPYGQSESMLAGMSPPGNQAAHAAVLKMTLIQIPVWSITLIFGLLPAARLVSYYVGGNRFTENRCRKCGYDLRATPERCPECGAIPTAAKGGAT